MLKRFFDEAGISTDGRTITNHSARVTLCSTLYNDRFADKSVMSRSKHRSSAVQQYQRRDFKILNDISNALEPKLPTIKVEKQITSDVVLGQQNLSSDKTFSDTATDNENLTVFVPKCVKKIIIVKDGKRICMDI